MKSRFIVFFILIGKLFGFDPIDQVIDPFIFINTMPKSGSVFLTDSLKQNLPEGYNFIRISQSRFHDDYVNKLQILNHRNHHVYTQEHVDVRPHNIKILPDYLPKFILHLRDPRQALLSWYHHVEKCRQGDYHLWSQDIQPPFEYFNWTEEDKLNWQIEHYLPCLVQWVEDWCSILDSNTFNILVTTFEEMNNNESAFLSRVFDFFNLSVSDLKYTPFTMDHNHQRKGSIDEWRYVFTDVQQQRISELVPYNLLERFNWDPSYTYDSRIEF